MTTDDRDRSASIDDGEPGRPQDLSTSDADTGADAQISDDAQAENVTDSQADVQQSEPPRYGSTRYEGSAEATGAAATEAPGADNSSAGAPQYGQQPGYQPGGSQDGAGQYGSTPNGAPAYGATPSGGPQYGAPGQGYGQTGAPQYGSAQYGAPQNGGPQYRGSQYGAAGQGYGQQQNYGQQQGYGTAPNSGGPYQFSGMPPQEARTMALITHLSAPALYLLSAGWAGFLAPLIMWAIYKDKDPLVRQAGAGSFNFNFALMILSIIAWVVGIVTFGLLLPLTFLAVFAILIVQVIFGIFGAMAANKGEAYKYPFEIPILK